MGVLVFAAGLLFSWFVTGEPAAGVAAVLFVCMTWDALVAFIRITRHPAWEKAHFWPKTVVGWASMLGICGSLLALRYLQTISHEERYALIALSAGALVASACSCRSWLIRRRPRPAEVPGSPLQPHPPALPESRDVLLLAAAAALLTLAVLPLLNALGGAPQRERGTIVVRNSHRPSSARRESSHIGRSVRVLLNDRTEQLEISGATEAKFRSQHCVDIDVHPGLLGVEWCLGDCLLPARQSIDCRH